MRSLREVARPVQTWSRTPWPAVVIAVATAAITLRGVPVGAAGTPPSRVVLFLAVVWAVAVAVALTLQHRRRLAPSSPA